MLKKLIGFPAISLTAIVPLAKLLTFSFSSDKHLMPPPPPANNRKRKPLKLEIEGNTG
ncbi:hypothetical protein [Mycoplasma wenyonii]|uniref:hypothetical protein n=1 Tax=Mycoplasma wenyonii TaxID=65123 RepID=UPI0015EB5C72|nr:hypothetical protein [Mycoplasma wenyonii]